jgi:hypothetical protein
MTSCKEGKQLIFIISVTINIFISVGVPVGTATLRAEG